MYGQKLIEQSGVTQASLRTWRLTRPLFGEFVEAHCSFTSGFRRFHLAAETPSGDYTETDADSPGLVLLDEHGGELWLTGCASGFTGEGVAGTGYVLYREGFDHAHVDLVPHMEKLHLRKGVAKPLLAVRRSENVRLEATWARHIEELMVNGYFKDVDED